MTKDSKLRQRLVGVIVLLSLAVILLPALVDYQREPKLVIDPVHAPPAPPYRDYQSRVVPIEIPPVVTDTNNHGAVSRAPIKLPGSRQESSKKTTMAPPEARSAATLVSGATESVSATIRSLDKGWVVQIGTFGKAESAEKIRAQLVAAGFVAFIEPLDTPAGTMKRVRIGPEFNRVDAEATQARLRADTEFEGIVLRFP